ncbi:MAG: N-6 DNA methylase [Clostridia bacterium]|nr:N-6 DNA methylase [Clostridia bacterium]
MFVKLQRFLEISNRSLTRNQAQQLFLYMAFVLRFCRKFSINLKEEDTLPGLLSRLFQKISRYEIKESAFAFDSYMPWNILQQDWNLHDSINELFYELYKTEFASAEWLINAVDEILGNEVLTPKLVRTLIAKLAAQKRVSQITDLCSGTFLLGLEVWNEMGKNDDVNCYGEEINPYFCAISRLLLFLCDVGNFAVKEQDVIKDNPDKIVSQASKVIVADLPLVGNRTIPVPDKDSFLSEKKRTLYADWMIIYKILQQLTSGDRAFLLVTKGALVRENEYFLRKHFIDADCVDAVMTLPNSIYPNYNLPMNLLIFEKGRSEERKGTVLFIDLNQESTPTLHDNTIEQIFRMFYEYKAEEPFARIVDYDEIVSKDYILNPQIYLAGEGVLDGQLAIRDIACVTRGIQDLSGNRAVNSKERYLLNVRDIQEGEIIYETAEVIEGGNPLWEEKFLIKEDDIIITAKGATIKLAIVPPNPSSAYISGNLMILRVNTDRYSPYVLYEYLLSEKGQRALNLIQTGTTIRVLGTKKMEQLKIPEYECETVRMIGDGLKLATLQYRQALEDANLKFKLKKEALLSCFNKRKGNENV